jgi:hypothetical protein
MRSAMVVKFCLLKMHAARQRRTRPTVEIAPDWSPEVVPSLSERKAVFQDEAGRVRRTSVTLRPA